MWSATAGGAVVNGHEEVACVRVLAMSFMRGRGEGVCKDAHATYTHTCIAHGTMKVSRYGNKMVFRGFECGFVRSAGVRLMS